MRIISPVQNHILAELKSAEKRRYRDLQPIDVPNDLFNYHLQFLVQKGYVARKEEGYSLTAVGVMHIADTHSSDAEKKISSLFKVNVITILSRVANGKMEILNQERKRHPSFGKIGVMGGVVYKGESLEAAATRKLKEETGLSATFKICGIERRRLYREDVLFSDVLFPIAYADKYIGSLEEENAFGRNLWVPIAKAIQNESATYDSIEALPRVLRRIRAGTLKTMPFFYTESTQSDT